MLATRIPAWCEQRQGVQRDGRYTVACYYTRDGHPVSKARAEKVILTEYADDGTPLRFQEGVIDIAANDEPLVLVSAGDRFPS
jgi:hypothetical protein